MAMGSLWANTAVAGRGSARACSISRRPSSKIGRLAAGTDHLQPEPVRYLGEALEAVLERLHVQRPRRLHDPPVAELGQVLGRQPAPPRSSWVTAGIPDRPRT